MATKDPTRPGGIVPRDDGGQVSLHACNMQQRKADRIAQAERDETIETAKMALEDALKSPLDRPRGGRQQKPLRA